MDDMTQYYMVMLNIMQQIKDIPLFQYKKEKNFEAWLDRAIRFGWSYETVKDDSSIGNTHSKFMQGFTTLTEFFSSVSDTILGKSEVEYEPFTPMKFNNEHHELSQFGVIPMDTYNKSMLNLFSTINGVNKWDNIMQYIVRMNQMGIPFKLDNVENPMDAYGTFDLFRRFKITNFSRDGLDFFDHLIRVVKIPNAIEMFRFVNKMIEFKVEYSTYYDFMTFFTKPYLGLRYYQPTPNYEIFYMFINDLMDLSKKGSVLFDYAGGRKNFENLVFNYRANVKVKCKGKTGEQIIPIFDRKSDTILNNKLCNLDGYTQVLRKLLFALFNFDRMIRQQYPCGEHMCNKLVDLVTSRKNKNKNVYKNVLHPFIDIKGVQRADINVNGDTTRNIKQIYIDSDIHNVLRFESDLLTSLEDNRPITELSYPIFMKNMHSGVDLTLCISALHSTEYEQLKNCKFSFQNEEKIKLINSMIPAIIDYANKKYNTDDRNQNSIKLYNKIMLTVNFMILYPVFAFEVILAAISNPRIGASGPPELPNLNWDSINDTKNTYNFANNNDKGKNIPREPIRFTPKQS